jgi:hypothetical protein
MLCSLILGISFTACSDDDEDKLIIDPEDYPAYILNEGIWEANNANISRFFPSYKGIDSDYYQKVNGKLMGDLANAMIEEDNNIYVVIGGSKYVARLDLNCVEQARYSFPEGEGEPRCIDVEDGYVYVTQHGGQVSKLDAQTLKLVSTFKGGDNLEGIVEKDGKLYVANAWKGVYDFNKELLVINVETMTKTGSIDVVLNPVQVQEIDDKIYVISQGNYEDVQAVLQVIDTKAGTSKVIVKDVDKITEGHNGLIYGVRSTYDADWNTINSFFTYNPKKGTVNETSFLQNAPSSISSTAIYLLEVGGYADFIYIGISDYVTNGTIYQFDASGKLLQSFDSGGINPNAMIFID